MAYGTVCREVTKGESTNVSSSVTLPRTSKERKREGHAGVRPVSWREDEETRGAMAESEQETMLDWVSQTSPSIAAKVEVVSVLRHCPSALRTDTERAPVMS